MHAEPGSKPGNLASPMTSQSTLTPEAGHRVGLIADTHGLLRLEAIQALHGVDRIIHAGDIGTPAVLLALREIAPVTAVRGNVDTGEWAQDLPLTATLTIDHVKVYVLHDRHTLDFAPEAMGVRVVVSGHSHYPSIQERNGVLYVNPGSAGPRRFRTPVSLALLEVQSSHVDGRLVLLAR